MDSYAAHGIGGSSASRRGFCTARDARVRFELRRGMFFTIEPMANEGTKRTRGPLREDGWSVVTADEGLSRSSNTPWGRVRSGRRVRNIHRAAAAKDESAKDERRRRR